MIPRTTLTNDFVEEPDALHALVDVLRVKVREEVRDGGEHHAGVLPALGVQLLEQSREGKEFQWINSRVQGLQVFLSLTSDWRSCSRKYLATCAGSMLWSSWFVCLN